MKNFNQELKNISKLSPADQQIALASLLAAQFKGYDVLLTVVGGAAVQFYTNADYVTKDLDAILSGDTKKIVDTVMTKLGFKRTNTYRHFEHPLFPFVVEFPPSPVEVGNRHLEKFNLLKIGARQVRVIRVEDIIMDRIIGGVEWDQDPLLDQAKLLWIKNKGVIDKKYLKGFAKSEGYARTLKEVMKL